MKIVLYDGSRKSLEQVINVVVYPKVIEHVSIQEDVGRPALCEWDRFKEGEFLYRKPNGEWVVRTGTRSFEVYENGAQALVTALWALQTTLSEFGYDSWEDSLWA